MVQYYRANDKTPNEHKMCVTKPLDRTEMEQRNVYYEATGKNAKEPKTMCTTRPLDRTQKEHKSM